MDFTNELLVLKKYEIDLTDIFQTLIFSTLFPTLGILVHDITPWLENPEVTAPVWHFRDVIGWNGLHQWIPRAEKIRNWSNWYFSKIKFFGWYFGLRSINSFLIMITWFFRQFSAWTPMFVIRCSNNENFRSNVNNNWKGAVAKSCRIEDCVSRLYLNQIWKSIPLSQHFSIRGIEWWHANFE